MIDAVPSTPGNLLELRGLVWGAKLSLDSRGVQGSQEIKVFGSLCQGRGRYTDSMSALESSESNPGLGD